MVTANRYAKTFLREVRSIEFEAMLKTTGRIQNFIDRWVSNPKSCGQGTRSFPAYPKIQPLSEQERKSMSALEHIAFDESSANSPTADDENGSHPGASKGVARGVFERESDGNDPLTNRRDSFRKADRNKGTLVEPDERIVRTEQLIELYHADVYRYAYWLSGCTIAAEDISQETFLRAFRGVHGLRDATAAKSWLLTITRNEFARWCNQSRANMTTRIDEGELHGLPAEVPHFETEEWVAKGLAQLTADYRLIVLMYYFEQLSYAEIAKQLDIPLGTVMSRLNRSRQQLKRVLENLSNPK